MANLSKTLFTALPIVLQTVEGWLGVTGDPNAAFPIVTYEMVSESDALNTGVTAFDSEAETFLIQISAFDDDETLVRLIDLQATIEGLLKDPDNWTNAGANMVSVRYVGGVGPRYISDNKYFQYTKTVRVTLAKNKTDPETDNEVYS